jgi:hypothetical protein
MSAIVDNETLRRNGIAALNKALGHAGALRFLSLVHGGSTDYVAISRRLYDGQTVDEVFGRVETNERAKVSSKKRIRRNG